MILLPRLDYVDEQAVVPRCGGPAGSAAELADDRLARVAPLYADARMYIPSCDCETCHTQMGS